MRWSLLSCWGGGSDAPVKHGSAEEAAPANSQSEPLPEIVGLQTTSYRSEHCESGPPSTQLCHSDSLQSADMPSKLKINFHDLSFYELIGKGSFKAVYRGRWNNTNVAVVSMRRGGVVKEARIQQLIGNHPNVVQFYRWTTDALANEFMIMEYVKLGSMDKVLLSHGKSLQMRQRLAMCEQICSGMYELANANVLHRDLAGRNILVSSLEPVHVKISDFGLAWIQPDGLSAQPEIQPEQLPSIPIRWSPPEVLTRCEWTEKSDVWSFGVTMWEIFSSGSEPYAHCTDEQVFNLVTSFKVLSRPKRCPKEVYGLMLRCWDKDPAQRPSFADILQVFRGWRELYHKKAVIKFSSGSVRRKHSSPPYGKASAKDRPQPGPVLAPLPEPRARPRVRRAAASVPDLSSMLLTSGVDSFYPTSMPGHETTSAMIDEVLSQNSRTLARRPSNMDSTHKMDLIHILSNVSLSHDGSSSTKSCQGLVVERIEDDDSLVAELPLPPSPKAVGKDMSLDYLVHLRAPPMTEIAEPSVSSESNVISFGPGSDFALATMLRRLNCQPERSTSYIPGASSSFQGRWHAPNASMPLPLRSPPPRLSYLPSQLPSRAASNTSLGTFLTSEGLSESRMSFEFEVPIDPMMSPTTSLSAQFDSINFSDIELGDDHDNQVASLLPHMLMTEIPIIQSHYLSPALGMIGSREPSFDSPRVRGQAGQRGSSRFVGSFSPRQPMPRAWSSVVDSRAPAAARAAGQVDSREPAASGLVAASRGAVRPLPKLKPQQLKTATHRPPSKEDTRRQPMSAVDARPALSPYVDLQYLVRAQDNGVMSGL